MVLLRVRHNVKQVYCGVEYLFSSMTPPVSLSYSQCYCLTVQLFQVIEFLCLYTCDVIMTNAMAGHKIAGAAASLIRRLIRIKTQQLSLSLLSTE